MSVKAVGIIASIWNMGAGQTGVTVSGRSTDGSVDFTGSVNSTINIGPVDWDSHQMNVQIEEGLKTALSASPYSMTFGSDDEVLVLPAVD